MSKIQSYRSAPLPEDPSSQKKQISFQDIYSNFWNRSGDSEANAGSEASKPSTSDFDAIRGSLRQFKGTNTNPTPSPRWRPSPSSPSFGETSTNRDSIFGKEIRERIAKVNDPAVASLKNFGSVRLYNPNELGEKLKILRPQVKGKEWFSIAELNERLKKVMEMDETEANSSSSDKGVYSILRNSVNHIKAKDAEKPKIASR